MINYSDLIKNNKIKTWVQLFYSFDLKKDNFFDLFILGEEELIDEFIENNKEKIKYKKNYLCKNSKLDLLDLSNIEARIEYNAVIREKVKIAKNAIIMMNSVINIGAEIGENTMVDMGAVVGSNAIIGSNVHIGANAVISGVLEPIGERVIIKDNVLIGANSFIKSGVTIGCNAVIGAGSVVLEDVLDNMVVAGVPARKINSNYKNLINNNLR